MIMKRFLLSACLLLLFTDLIQAQDSKSKIVTENPAYYGPVFIEIVSIDDPAFPSWSELKDQMSFSDFAAQVKSWIIAHPAEYHNLLSTYQSRSHINTATFLQLTPEIQTRIRMTVHDWDEVVTFQRTLNQNFDLIKQLEQQYSAVGDGTVVLMFLIHKNDLTYYFNTL